MAEKNNKNEVTLEDAVKRIFDLYSSVTEQMLQIRNDIATANNINLNRYEDISRRIDNIQAETSEWNNKLTAAVEECKQQLRHVTRKDEEIFQMPESRITNNPWESFVTPNLLNIDDRQRLTTQSNFGNVHKVEEDSNPIFRDENKTFKSQTIVIPPSTAIPTFAGKPSDRPNQFLVRIQEYAETVHGWDKSTLLHGISQFLRDNALEWYCQLRAAHRRPQTWPEFVELFNAQFNSPLRQARQEQEWYECKQKEDESIDDFIIRLRALWVEQKPKETEVDLIRHLFCKMRNDLLSMIGVPRHATLDDIILEAKKVEEVLYRRKRDERRLKYLSHNTTQNEKVHVDKARNDTTNKQRNPYSTMNTNYLSKNKRTTNEINDTQQSESVRCYNCGKWGHVIRNCPTNNSTIYRSNEAQRYSKNDGRA